MRSGTSMCLALGSLIGILVISSVARADESAYSQQAASFALTSGLGRATAPVLERRPLDRPAVAARLGADLGGDWQIVVAPDGTAASGRRASAAAPPAPAKLDLATLERLGRAFISAHLSSVVVPRAGERIVLLRSIYELQGGQSASGRRDPDLVRANRVVFGRELDRLRVVGGGSTISITFGPDGAPASFEYDWPAYAVTSTVSIAPPAAILGRLQRVAAVRSGGAAAASSAVPPIDTSRGYPAALAPGVQLSRTECGYYDPGVFAMAGSGVIQPACKYEVVHSTSLSGQVIRSGLGGAVPAAVVPLPDARWPELQLLLGAGSGAADPGPAAVR